MFVAVIGGFFDLDPIKKDEAKAYAVELGAALARAGFGLVVYYSNENSLEPHVVKGYVAALPRDPATPCIRVRYPEKQDGKVRFDEQQTRQALFDPKHTPLDDWEAPFYRSLVEPGGTDAVVLMAGGRSVLIAGQIAVARHLPTLALNNFGGSARVIWRELSQTTTGYPTATTSPLPELVEWLVKQCDARARKAQAAAQREAEYKRLTSSKLPKVLTAIAIALFVGILALGVSNLALIQDYYAVLTFIGLLVAGATGALARTLFWGRRKIAVTTSLSLGGLAGVLVGAAYLIPQLFGAPGVLDATDDRHAATIQFISALITAVSAGVGFDTVFNRIKDRAAELPIEPAESE